MSAAYIVVGIRNGILDKIESHAGRMAAFERANIIAEDYIASIEFGCIISEPKETSKDADNSRWIFYYNTLGRHSVQVFFKQTIIPMPKNIPILINDDPLADKLPGGWDLDGRPITMELVKKNSFNVKDYECMHDNQQFALVIARIRKQSNYLQTIECNYDYMTFNQQGALDELKKRTDFGIAIMDSEINLLASNLHSIKNS